MTFHQKVDAFVDFAYSEGIPRWNVAPPPFRVLWKVGVEIPPPAFLRGMQAALVEGLFFGLAFGLFFLQVFPLNESLVFAAGTGLMYSLVGWIQHFDIVQQLDPLPEWERYLPGITYY